MMVTISADGVPDKAYPIGDGNTWAACKPAPRETPGQTFPKKLPQWLLIHVPSQAWVTATHLKADCAIFAEELDAIAESINESWATTHLSWVKGGVLKPAFERARARISLNKAEKGLVLAQKKEDKAA